MAMPAYSPQIAPNKMLPGLTAPQARPKRRKRKTVVPALFLLSAAVLPALFLRPSPPPSQPAFQPDPLPHARLKLISASARFHQHFAVLTGAVSSEKNLHAPLEAVVELLDKNGNTLATGQALLTPDTLPCHKSAFFRIDMHCPNRTAAWRIHFRTLFGPWVG